MAHYIDPEGFRLLTIIGQFLEPFKFPFILIKGRVSVTENKKPQIIKQLSLCFTLHFLLMSSTDFTRNNTFWI